MYNLILDAHRLFYHIKVICTPPKIVAFYETFHKLMRHCEQTFMETLQHIMRFLLEKNSTRSQYSFFQSDFFSAHHCKFLFSSLHLVLCTFAHRKLRFRTVKNQQT